MLFVALSATESTTADDPLPPSTMLNPIGVECSDRGSFDYTSVNAPRLLNTKIALGCARI
jgi:hypothetical protein